MRLHRRSLFLKVWRTVCGMGRGVMECFLKCHSERSEESLVLCCENLRYAQNDKERYLKGFMVMISFVICWSWLSVAQVPWS